MHICCLNSNIIYFLKIIFYHTEALNRQRLSQHDLVYVDIMIDILVVAHAETVRKYENE